MNLDSDYLVSFLLVQFSSVQSLSRVRLFATPWITARQASMSITNSQSSLKLMFIELVMPSSHLILCHPLLFLPPIPPSIRVFSNESTLCMRWPKYWSFSLSISPSNEHPGLVSFRMDWFLLVHELIIYEACFFFLLNKINEFCTYILEIIGQVNIYLALDLHLLTCKHLILWIRSQQCCDPNWIEGIYLRGRGWVTWKHGDSQAYLDFESVQLANKDSQPCLELRVLMSTSLP